MPKVLPLGSLRQRRFKNLDERIERNRIIAIVTTTRKNKETSLRCFRCDFASSSRFPDPRITTNHHDGTAAQLDAIKASAKRISFCVSTDEFGPFGPYLERTWSSPEPGNRALKALRFRLVQR